MKGAPPWGARTTARPLAFSPTPSDPDARPHLTQVWCYNIYVSIAVVTGNPFKHDQGTSSPLDAGRAKERKGIQGVLGSIRLELVEGGHELRTRSAVIIHGPRRVGKTALLGYAREQASLLGIKALEVDNAILGGSGEGLGRAISHIVDKDRFLEATRDSKQHPGLYADEFDEAGLPLPSSFSDALTACSLSGPVLLAVDDAHLVEPERMYNLCIEFQSMVSGGKPVAMVMAGSSNLNMFIRETGAVFMERSNHLDVNLFTEEETREALEKGFEDAGMTVEPDALGRMAEWSGRHPQFIEMAGARTWDAAKGKGAGVVTLADAEAGLAKAEKARDGFYEDRLGELLGSGVKPQALQVIEMMRVSGKGLTDEKALEGLMEANDGMEFEQAWGIMQELKDLGFLHKEGKRNQEGVPRLFEYVRRKAAKEPASP